VNEALNEIYLHSEEYEMLWESVRSYETFDQLGLARSIQGHELMEFRRIAAFLYRLIIYHISHVDASRSTTSPST
jgi:clathrin heavy chain